MSTRVSIIFPYSGDDKDLRVRLHQIIKSTLDPRKGLHTSTMKPVIVVNRDTENRGLYKKFENYLKDEGDDQRLNDLDILKVWSVDTCQMWLAGFGKIIDDKNKNSNDDTTSILQIPGDLKYIRDFDNFLNQLVGMNERIQSNSCEFIIGDFKVEPEKSKHLIDLYGTYPLLFNWFPEIAEQLREEIKIKRPRSEFFSASINFLSEMLYKRKFAYEQTIAFLIYALKGGSRWRINKVDIGIIGDYGENRGFREATDQIERTERLLKLLWREINGGDRFDVKEFERLDRRSTAIREAAIVSLENFLKP